LDSGAEGGIEADPRYRTLVSARRRLTWALSATMLALYLGFLLLVAFNKPLMARPVGSGVLSIGILLGLAVILSAIALTAIYVRRSTAVYDPLVDAIRADHGG
jgi:uncharacterized membrane protein (DUF485 family)